MFRLILLRANPQTSRGRDFSASFLILPIAWEINGQALLWSFPPA